MFSNIGNKIRILAKVICIIGMVISAIFGLIIIIGGFTMFRDSRTVGFGVLMIFGGLLSAALGAFFSWIGSFTLYGYGQLILSVQNLEKQFCETTTDDSFSPAQPDAAGFGFGANFGQTRAATGVECPNCHQINTDDSKFCVKCGTGLK